MFEADVVESLLPELVDFLGELEVDVIELRGAQNPGRAHLENLPAAEQCALCTVFCHLLCMWEDPVRERFATLQHDTRFLQPDQLAICGCLHVIVELIILDISRFLSVLNPRPVFTLPILKAYLNNNTLHYNFVWKV